MPYTLNDKLKDLKPYDPISGDYSIRLDANESFLELPIELLEKAQYAMADIAFNRYPDPNATELCESFGAYYGIDPALVTAGNGSDEWLFIIASSFLMRGDKILTVEPDFSMYRFYGFLAEAESVVYQKKEDLTIDVDALIAAVNESGAKVVLFSNPCNPTSLGLRREEVRKLITSVSALVVLDEAYMDFWDQSLLHDAPALSNLIVLRTLSKAWGAAGLRLGFAVSSPGLISALNAARSPYNVGTPAQILGRILLEQGESRGAFLAEQARKLEGQLKLLLPQARVFPTHTNFVYLETQDAAQIYEYLKEQGIIIRLFGQNALRITASVDEELGALYAALEQMKEASK